MRAVVERLLRRYGTAPSNENTAGKKQDSASHAATQSATGGVLTCIVSPGRRGPVDIAAAAAKQRFKASEQGSHGRIVANLQTEGNGGGVTEGSGDL